MNRSVAIRGALSGAEIERLWLEEAQRRSDAFDRGELKAVPGEQVFRRIWREILGTRTRSEEALVTARTTEPNKTYELTPQEEAELIAALEEAERGETVDDSHVRQLIEQARR